MRDRPELQWILSGFTPDTIPMARLAEYLVQLARLLGDEASVHFNRVERGSVVVAVQAAPAAFGRITARARKAKEATERSDLGRTFRQINKMLGEDNVNAHLRERSAVILRFPGVEKAEKSQVQITDTGYAIGQLYMLSGGEGVFKARVRLESGKLLNCTSDESVALRLREFLFEKVKVYGQGIWSKSEAGQWEIESLHIDTVVRVDSAKLSSIVEHLRRLDIDWPDDPLGYLDRLNSEGSAIQ